MIASILLKRAGMIVVTMFGVAVIVFFLLRVAPGDPISMMIGPGATPEDIAAICAHYGFDKSLWVQFGIWLAGIIRGDFGVSIFRIAMCSNFSPSGYRRRLSLPVPLWFSRWLSAASLRLLALLYGGALSKRPSTASMD